jgi:hypothetical protein
MASSSAHSVNVANDLWELHGTFSARARESLAQCRQSIAQARRARDEGRDKSCLMQVKIFRKAARAWRRRSVALGLLLFACALLACEKEPTRVAFSTQTAPTAVMEWRLTMDDSAFERLKVSPANAQDIELTAELSAAIDGSTPNSPAGASAAEIGNLSTRCDLSTRGCLSAGA